MRFDIPEKLEQQLLEAFAKVEGLEVVYIYGSRAKGTHKKNSDIDLGLVFAPDSKGSHELWSLVDDLPTVYKIDLTDEAKLTPGSFKDEYEKTKKVFWERAVNNKAISNKDIELARKIIKIAVDDVRNQVLDILKRDNEEKLKKARKDIKS